MGEIRFPIFAFIPSEAEFVAADRLGNVYGPQVPGQTRIRYEHTGR